MASITARVRRRLAHAHMASGEFAYVNPQWMRFTGLAFDDIKAWGWTHAIIHGLIDREAGRARLQQVSKGMPQSRWGAVLFFRRGDPGLGVAVTCPTARRRRRR